MKGPLDKLERLLLQEEEMKNMGDLSIGGGIFFGGLLGCAMSHLGSSPPYRLLPINTNGAQ